MVWVTRRIQELLTWQSKQPALLRWGAVVLLFITALLVRCVFGRLHGANPALTFYPALLVAAALLGWKEASVVLILSDVVGSYLFLPARMYLEPVAWFLVGGFNIAIIAGLQHLAKELAAANERQRVLFEELQHRVANTLQTVVGIFGVAQRRIASAPDQAATLLEESSARISAAADVHRRLHDPTLFEKGLETILADAVAATIDRRTINLRFDIEALPLTFDQMSAITMLAIEAANNAQKHVFGTGRGSTFDVSLKARGSDTIALTVRDDGPGHAVIGDAGRSGLGMRIIEGLAKQMGGRLTVRSDHGTEIRVEFLRRQRQTS